VWLVDLCGQWACVAGGPVASEPVWLVTADCLSSCHLVIKWHCGRSPLLYQVWVMLFCLSYCIIYVGFSSLMLGLVRPVTADCEAPVMILGIIYVIRSQSSRCVKFWINTLDAWDCVTGLMLLVCGLVKPECWALRGL
jgi:hypothetical protein